MARPHKFTPGEPIVDLTRFARLMDEHRWVYFRDKPTHPGWAISWSFRTVHGAIRRGYLREANPTEVQP